MAAVYTADGGVLKTKGEGLTTENNLVGAKHDVESLMINTKKIKVEDTSGDPVQTEQVTSSRHAAAMDAVPVITIKEERIGDDEYFQIKLGDIGESSDDITENNDESDGDNESIDVKLRSMRCQDCGEQFTRWEAFKIHLRQHVEEEKREIGKQSTLDPQREASMSAPGYEKLDKNAKDDQDSWLDDSWEVNPSDVFNVRPQGAMLSQEETPVYGSSHRVYACAICGKVYSYLESFKNHQKVHQSKHKKPCKNVFPCTECGKVFSRASSLTTHLKVHNIEDISSTFKCDQCNKSFNSSQTWIAHKEIHRQKPFWCLSCARGFKDSRGLDRHMLGHELKRHKCDLCPKTFRVPAELRYHYNTHTGAKPFRCGLCRKTFSQLGNLITHRKKHVGVYKEGSETPLGATSKQNAGKRRVIVMKKLIVSGMQDVGETAVERMNTAEQVAESDEEVESEEAKGEAQEELECFECGCHFSQESELHLHYMKHASGEV